MATAEILNITEVPLVDESIEKLEHHEYEPITGTSINNPGEIRINIEQQDLFFHLSDDYDKVVYGFKHTITLVRKTDDDAIFRAGAVAAAKVKLDKISLFMPSVLPSDNEKLQLFKTIDSKATVPATYRARQCDSIVVPQSTTFSWRLSVKTSPEKPRYIIVAFQTAKSGNQEANPAIVNHCDLKNMYIMLNQDRYPAVDYNLSFPNQQFC